MNLEQALHNIQIAIDTRFTGTKGDIIALDQSLAFLKSTIEAQAKLLEPKPEN